MDSVLYIEGASGAESKNWAKDSSGEMLVLAFSSIYGCDIYVYRRIIPGMIIQKQRTLYLSQGGVVSF